MPPKGTVHRWLISRLVAATPRCSPSFTPGWFDWQIDHHEQANYRSIQQESGGIGGGIFQHMEGMPPNHPSVAVMVNDLQAYLDKAVSLGGSALMQPTEIPGRFGSIAIFYDIAGNRIALFKSSE